MNKVFDKYSEYYNLLYFDKDYQSEANYIAKLISKFSLDAKNILELGCGTGKHANLLAEKGYSVLGIDLSETMLKEAYKLQNQHLVFEQADVRTFSIDKQFDAVLSLFHVVNYQTTEDDLIKYFQTASKHLKKDGIFIFDTWYGPAVLAQKPEHRVKNLENENIQIERVATPKIYLNKNLVDINYTIKITDKNTNLVDYLEETHKIRYLFKPEIDKYLTKAGFKLIYCKEWLSENEPSENTWGVCLVGIKK